jgi:acyl carrier protein
VRIRRETDADPASVILDVQLLDPNGEVIAAVDGFTLRQISAGRGVTVEGAEDAPQADAAPAACHRQPALLEQLAGASEEERRQRLVDYARQQIARVLGLDAVQVDLRQPLNSLGLDSLMAFELKSRLDMELGLDVPMVAFLDGSDVPGLAAMLSRQLGAVASSGTGGDGADRGADWIEGEL